jgi:hypothetical protein
MIKIFNGMCTVFGIVLIFFSPGSLTALFALSACLPAVYFAVAGTLEGRIFFVVETFAFFFLFVIGQILYLLAIMLIDINELKGVETLMNYGIIFYFSVGLFLFQCLLVISDLAETRLSYQDIIAYAWPAICVAIYLVFFSDLNFAAADHAPFAYLFYLGASVSWAAVCGLFLLNSISYKPVKG